MQWPFQCWCCHMQFTPLLTVPQHMWNNVERLSCLSGFVWLCLWPNLLHAHSGLRKKDFGVSHGELAHDHARDVLHPLRQEYTWTMNKRALPPLPARGYFTMLVGGFNPFEQDFWIMASWPQVEIKTCVFQVTCT